MQPTTTLKPSKYSNYTYLNHYIGDIKKNTGISDMTLRELNYILTDYLHYKKYGQMYAKDDLENIVNNPDKILLIRYFIQRHRGKIRIGCDDDIPKLLAFLKNDRVEVNMKKDDKDEFSYETPDMSDSDMDYVSRELEKKYMYESIEEKYKPFRI